jgi:hypothetical protein
VISYREIIAAAIHLMDRILFRISGGAMSVTANLIRYPAEVIEQVRSEGEFYPPDGVEELGDCHLDRSWDELHPALRTFGHPLELTLSGDYGLVGGLYGFGWEKDNDNDHYVAFVSPQLVQEIAAALGGLSFDNLEKKLPKETRGAKYVKPFFDELAKFYAAASNAGDCVFIYVA